MLISKIYNTTLGKRYEIMVTNEIVLTHIIFGGSTKNKI